MTTTQPNEYFKMTARMCDGDRIMLASIMIDATETMGLSEMHGVFLNSAPPRRATSSPPRRRKP